MHCVKECVGGAGRGPAALSPTKPWRKGRRRDLDATTEMHMYQFYVEYTFRRCIFEKSCFIQGHFLKKYNYLL